MKVHPVSEDKCYASLIHEIRDIRKGIADPRGSYDSKGPKKVQRRQSRHIGCKLEPVGSYPDPAPDPDPVGYGSGPDIEI